MAEEVLGSGISKGVTDQIKLREALIGQAEKNKEHLMFFNSNGAWVRLASSVDTLTHAESIKFADNPTVLQVRAEQGREFGDSTLASNNLLFGGMFPDATAPGGGILEDKWHEPYKVDSRGFQKTDDDANRIPLSTKSVSYHNYQSTGYRPVPGITSVSIQSKNTYGTLREAEVEVVVWTVEDLELMQAIYLRPGYTMLLEWGHTLGLDNTGLIKEPLPFNKFFKKQVSQQEIEQYLINNARDNNYNYDGMYGYVSNFSWTFRQDGGYDCTLKIISKGSILESLALCFDTSNVYPADKLTVGSDETSKDERRSPFHKFKLELTKATISNKSISGFTRPNNQSIGDPGQTIQDPVLGTLGGGRPGDGEFQVAKIFKYDLISGSAEPFVNRLSIENVGGSLLAFPVKYITEVVTEEETNTIKGDKYYIPLGVFLDIYNNFIPITDPTLEPKPGTASEGYKYVEFYTGWQDFSDIDIDTDYKIPYKKESKFLTSQYHFSINPLVCVIPGQLDNRSITFKDPDNGCESIIKDFNSNILPSTHNMGAFQINNFDLAVRDAFANKEIRGSKDDILNILISLDHIIDLLDQIIKEDVDSDQNTSNNMTVFMQRLLKDINKSLGGVNDLDVVYDESDNLFYIADRRLTPTTLPPKLTLAGLNTTITDLNISSTISSNISSQISIAAQGGNQGTKDNIGPLLQWNQGLIDRHLKVKSPKTPSTSSEQGKKTETDRLRKWLEDYMEVWLAFKVGSRAGNIEIIPGAGGYAGLNLSTDNTVTTYKVLDETTIRNLSSLESYFRIYCQKYVTEYYYKAKENVKPPPGVIPVELSFTTIGIAGLKIGQSFGFERGVLPQTYSDNFGFIITGLSHNLTNNKWTTDVKTQFFCIQNPPQLVLDEYAKQFDCAVEAAQEEPIATGVELGVSQEWWTLVAICFAENYPENYQGYADVAQSLYNRANAGNIYSNGSIVANILAPNQYEPTFVGRETNPDGARLNTRKWANIRDINTAGEAIISYYRARQSTYIPSPTQVYKWLKKCSEVLQDTNYQQAAAVHVGSRTEFLAYTPKSGNAVGAKYREPYDRNNVFFWNYGGKTYYYDTGKIEYTPFNIVKPPPEAVVI